MTMRWFGLWHGGRSYGDGSIDEFLERFESLEQAREEFATRYRSGRMNTFRWVDGTVTHEDTPAVDEGCVLRLWRDDPRGDGGRPAPDMGLVIGPRGGVRAR